MCGIYGEVSLRSLTPPPWWGEQATDLLSHRGPDDRGTWHSAGVFLGARRLSIMDPAGGDQPMLSEDGQVCLVYNGELYNFAELRRELVTRGHVFRTRSDTEVVLESYREWGPACLERFNGMFALAAWNNHDRTLFLARDRIGEKPLYYYRDSDRLAFASEIKALLADPGLPRVISWRGLGAYLALGHSMGPHTIYEGIEKLRPGHSLFVRDGAVQVSAYWNLAEAAQSRNDQAAASFYEESVRSLLRDSVRRRMVADAPVGAFLSGGVDSSAVVANMAQASSPVSTFSVGFEGEGVQDERAQARSVARAIGTRHEDVTVRASEVMDALRQLAYQYDEPFADAAAVPLLILSRAASSEVKVVLTGDGGDELFGGYRRYVADRLARAYQTLPTSLTKRLIPRAVEQLPSARRLKRAARTLPIADPAERYTGWLEVFSPASMRELLLPELRAAVTSEDVAADYTRHYARLAGPDSGPDHLNRLMFVDVNTLLVDGYLEKTDKATMACGLEARLPLLDHRLVELAFAIPSRHKIKGFSTKCVLREAVRELVPSHVLRSRKHGLTPPIDGWLRADIYQDARALLLDERARARGYFDHHHVDRLLREHAEGRHNHGRQIWALLNFEVWHRIYLDREAV